MNPLSIKSLQQLSSESLQELEKQYPYFLLPKMFRLKQYHEVKHAEYEPYLHKTAVFAYSRKALYDFIHPEAPVLNSNPIPKAETELIQAAPILETTSVIEPQMVSSTLEPTLIQEETPPAPPERLVENQLTEDTREAVSDEVMDNATSVTENPAPIAEEIIEEVQEQMIAEKQSDTPIESLSTESVIEENTMATDPIPIAEPVANIREIEAMVYENLKDILEPGQQAKQEKASADEVIEAATANSFLQWLRIVEKDRVAGSKKESTSKEIKSIIQKPIPEFPEKEQKIKVRKDPELDALDGFVKDQIRRKKKKNAHVLEIPFEKTLENSTMPQEIYTEALAQLLTKQGKYEKAIDMYEKLILKYPEKSSFFAVQINLIKELNS